MLGTLLGTMLGAFQTSCVTSANFDGTRYQCPDGSCPDGFTCTEMVCIDNNTLSDASDGDGGGTGVLCGTPTALTTSFDVKPFFLGSSGTGTATYSNSQLYLELNPGPESFREAQIFSRTAFNLSGGRLAIEVNEVNTNPQTRVAFRLWTTGSTEELVVYYSDNILYAARWLDGVDVDAEAIVYNPGAHRYWSIREQDGRVFFETSPDRRTWSLLKSIQAPSWINQSFLRMGLIDAQGSVGLSAIFGELFGENTSDPTVPGCTTADLNETFDDNELAFALGSFATDCELSFAQGEARFSVGNSSEAFCGIFSLNLLDLRDRPVAIQFAQDITAPVDSTHLEVEGQGGSASFDMYPDLNGAPRVLYLLCPNNVCSQLADQPVDPTQRYWRFRATNQTLFWEVSADGTSWSIVAQAADTIVLSRATVNFRLFNSIKMNPTPLAIESFANE